MTDNQKKADKYLLQIRNADREITELILKIDYLRYKASGTGAIRYDKDHVQTSPEDMVCDAITEAVYLERALSDRHKELQEMRRYTELVIQLWNDNNARLIEMYYLSRKAMNEVARELNCSSRNAYLVKLKALEEFAKHL